MPERGPASAPPRRELIRAVAARIGSLLPGGRVVARDVLGAGARIDLVAADAGGGAVLVLLADPGRDLEGVARAVGQRAWVEARLLDWLQLAPDLGLRPERGVAVRLLAAAFGEEARAAAAALAGVELCSYQCVHGPDGLEVLVQASALGPEAARPEPGAAGPVGPPEPVPPVDPAPLRAAPTSPPAPTPAFRTGLRDADLDLDPDERAEFESAS